MSQSEETCCFSYIVNIYIYNNCLDCVFPQASSTNGGFRCRKQNCALQKQITWHNMAYTFIYTSCVSFLNNRALCIAIYSFGQHSSLSLTQFREDPERNCPKIISLCCMCVCFQRLPNQRKSTSSIILQMCIFESGYNKSL